MKKLTLEQWEKKYIVGPVAQFDAKYSMYSRPEWDSELQSRSQDWSFMGSAKDKPGWNLEDLALRRATNIVTYMLRLLNFSKPNLNRTTQAVRATLEDLGVDLLTTTTREGTKIDTSDRQRITLIIKKIAKYFGADLVGICKLDRRWLYSDTITGGDRSQAGANQAPPNPSKPQEIPEEFQYAVVMASKMDYELYKYFSCALPGGSTGLGYSEEAFTGALVAEYIRNLGFKAIDCTTNDVGLTIPMAAQAGLGELGRNGMLITPRFGPRIRLFKVITDLPLLPDSPIDFGVTQFCEACGKCADMCPSQSILKGKRTSEPRNVSNAGGTLKWPINAETCRMYWSRAKKGGGCTVCISCCDYNKADIWPHRTVRWFTDHIRWADPFYVKMDNLLGYGKPRKPDDFWEEWHPNPR